MLNNIYSLCVFHMRRCSAGSPLVQQFTSKTTIQWRHEWLHGRCVHPALVMVLLACKNPPRNSAAHGSFGSTDWERALPAQAKHSAGCCCHGAPCSARQLPGNRRQRGGDSLHSYHRCGRRHPTACTCRRSPLCASSAAALQRPQTWVTKDDGHCLLPRQQGACCSAVQLRLPVPRRQLPWMPLLLQQQLGPHSPWQHDLATPRSHLHVCSSSTRLRAHLPFCRSALPNARPRVLRSRCCVCMACFPTAPVAELCWSRICSHIQALLPTACAYCCGVAGTA